jgi:hypothetical protein
LTFFTASYKTANALSPPDYPYYNVRLECVDHFDSTQVGESEDHGDAVILAYRTHVILEPLYYVLVSECEGVLGGRGHGMGGGGAGVTGNVAWLEERWTNIPSS